MIINMLSHLSFWYISIGPHSLPVYCAVVAVYITDATTTTEPPPSSTLCDPFVPSITRYGYYMHNMHHGMFVCHNVSFEPIDILTKNTNVEVQAPA